LSFAIVVAIGPDFLRFNAFENDLGSFRIVPETRGSGFGFFFLDESYFSIVVKDTSSEPQRDSLVL
jgi:hypothetical protein